jgi:hypothetical protein
MGHIKEPKDIEFVVDSTPLTTEDKKRISEVIAYYKATGRKKVFREQTKQSVGLKAQPLTASKRKSGST